MKWEERAEARRLRREEGMAIKAIATEVGVAPSSVSRWVRDIALTREQHEVLRAANPAYNRQVAGQGGRRRSARRVREAAQERGREDARTQNPLHHAGCMLHWAEGSKMRNEVRMTNSDPALLRLYVRFLRECFGLASERMTLAVNVHLGNGLALDDVHAFWLDTLSLPTTCLRAATVVPSTADELRRRKLPYGTARLTVCSVELVQRIYGAIQEYGGFDRPEWLE